jgi:putative DNA primase/helicase
VSDRTELLDAALAYAAAGLPVFALQPRGKRPVTRRGFYDATTNPMTIERMWRIADRNIGIPTGPLSAFWAIDIDPGGQDGIDRLQDKYGPLPPTRTALTPRGGYHLWFQYIGPVPNSAGKIAPNVDVRATSGYVVAPPSVTDVGIYTWSGDPAAPIAVAPDWLIAMARAKPKPSISERAPAMRRPVAPTGTTNAYGAAALDRETSVLAATPAGQRNHRLNNAAFRLYQLVAGGELDGAVVEHRLVAACHANGLIKDDGICAVTTTIASGMRAGLLHPRSRHRGAA